MEHLGILAHSVEGAALCLRSFSQRGFELLGAHHHPDVTLDCIAFGRTMEAWEVADYETVRAVLAESARRLQRAGATFFVCPDNTAHIALEEPGEDLAIPGLHIADVVAGSARGADRRRVGIMGTTYLTESQVYPRALRAVGVECLVPEEPERRLIDAIIFDRLVAGVFADEDRAEYVAIIDHFRERGCDAVALACTEIPLLIEEEASPLPALDSTRLLAYAAVDVATRRQPMPTWRGGPRS